MRPAHGTLRLTRTALLASACTGLAWVGHNLWAQSPAGAGGFLLATAFLFGLLWRFTRIMRGFGDIFAVMAPAQVALHLILQGPGLVTLEHGAGHSGHGLFSHALGFAPGMLFAHLWAALLASALLAHGESALWSLVTAVSRTLPRPLRVPDLSFSAPRRTLTSALFTALSPPGPSAHGPRGPPVRPRSASAPPDPHHGSGDDEADPRTRTSTDQNRALRTRTAPVTA